MGKNSKSFSCSNCGHKEPKWTGKCSVCGEWNTFLEEDVSEYESKIISSIDKEISKLIRLKDISLDSKSRISSGLEEFDRVLGQGFVEDEVVLLSGEPGVGKSTLLIQVLHNVSKKGKALYFSGEESDSQVARRASRILEDEFKESEIFFSATSNLNRILKTIDENKPEIVVVDSIQTIYDPDVESLPGGMAQVRTCSSKLIYHAKTKGYILVLVGQINKEGKVAGPKVLEHLVDCVISFEGHKQNDIRVLRPLKNRFGSVDEVGIIEMTAQGFKDLNINSNTFGISTEEKEIGLANTIIIEGSRPLLVSIQSLVNKTVFPFPKRVGEGVGISKIQLITAIINKTKLANINDSDVYVMTAGGYNIKSQTNADLATVASILSSHKNSPLAQNLILFGEVGLNGKVYISQKSLKFIDEITRIFPNYTVVMPKIDGYKKAKNLLPVENLYQLKSILFS